MIRFRPLTFSKAELAAVPDEHRVAYVALGQIATECFILKRLIIASINSIAPPQPRTDAAHATALYGLRMLGRLVCESHNTVNSPEVRTAFAALSEAAPRADPKAAEEIQSAYESRRAFNQAVSRSDVLKPLRNGMAAHIDLQLTRESFAGLPDDIQLVDHWTELRGNAVYGAADTMHLTALAAIHGTANVGQALNDTSAEVTRASGFLTDFIDGFMVAFVVTHFGVERLQEPLVSIEGEPAVGDMRAPLFFTAAP